LSAIWIAAPAQFQTGDLLIGDSQGQIQWRRHDGSPVKLLNTSSKALDLSLSMRFSCGYGDFFASFNAAALNTVICLPLRGERMFSKAQRRAR
jgi:hypothetical protein